MAGYVELFKVGKTYPTPRGPAVIVQDFTLNIAEGEFVSLIGHSGCGKSTLLGMVAGLIEITAGGIAVARREIDGPGPDRGVVFQSPCLLPWLTALENVLLGVDSVLPYLSKADRVEVAAYYLELVGLGDSMDRRAKQLSQGMQQRVGIARAFAISPKMLLLDEPFGMLDSLTRMELQDVLLELLARDKMTTLMVTHDVDEALYLSDRIVMMTNGPNAKVGDILHVPFDRPREREAVVAHASYYELRERMLVFLDEQEQLKHASTGDSPPSRKLDVPQATITSPESELAAPFVPPPVESSDTSTYRQAVASVGK